MSTIEGGMVCTKNEELSQMLRMVRSNGWDRNLPPSSQEKLRNKFNVESEFQAKYTFYDLGYNLRPTEITGFIGLEQLNYLEKNIKKRIDNHNELNSVLIKNTDFIGIEHKHIDKISPFAFPVICKNPEKKSIYFKKFTESGIEIRPMIAGNIQNQPFFKKYIENRSNCPGADFLHENSFYCANYPELNASDLSQIKNCLLRSN
jgi:CDP-6-deoxy-D-xylo-4-hexulose-3-dehydrase